MADATDLKSVGPKGPCGFESRHRQERALELLVLAEKLLSSAGGKSSEVVGPGPSEGGAPHVAEQAEGYTG
jgi:hypothetical protein